MHMSRFLASLLPGCLVLALAGTANAQFAATGTTTVSVAISPKRPSKSTPPPAH